jgi:hypothetical protein
MADGTNKDLKALQTAAEAQANVGNLVDEYVWLTVVGGGTPEPSAGDLWNAKEGVGKLFRAELESGDSDTIMRALNGLADLRRQHREKLKQGDQRGERDVKHGGAVEGAASAASTAGGGQGDHEVSPDKPTRADHGRSAIDQDSQRKIQAEQREPKHPMADDKHDHGKKAHADDGKKHK